MYTRPGERYSGRLTRKTFQCSLRTSGFLLSSEDSISKARRNPTDLRFLRQRGCWNNRRGILTVPTVVETAVLPLLPPVVDSVRRGWRMCNVAPLISPGICMWLRRRGVTIQKSRLAVTANRPFRSFNAPLMSRWNIKTIINERLPLYSHVAAFKNNIKVKYSLVSSEKRIDTNFI